MIQRSHIATQRKSQSRVSQSYLKHIGLYLINPFLALLLSFRHYHSHWFKNFLWLFMVFYGFSFSFVDTMDASHYKFLFERAQLQYADFSSITHVFDPTRTGQLDFARPLINFVLSGFTSNYHVLFAVYGLIFGFFYSRNISFLIQNCNLKGKNITAWLFFAAFFVGAWQINGFRFWTATHIFLFGIIMVQVEGRRKRGLLWMFLSLAFHFSFILPLIVFAAYKFIPKLNKAFLVLLLGLLFFNPFSDLGVVRNAIKKYTVNEVMERKVDTYTSTEVAERLQNRESTFGLLKKVVGKINNLIIILLAWRALSLINLPELRRYRSMYQFGLILAVIGSVLSFIPSVGRFHMVGMLLLLFIVVIIHSYNLRGDVNKYSYKGLGLLGVMNVFLSGNWILFTFSIHFFVGNFFSVFFDDKEVLYSLGNLLSDLF